MQLPEEDERYLKEKGHQWELIANGNDACLVIRQYRLAPGKYDRDNVDLMMRIPSGYNNTKLDMFYVAPPVHLKADGKYPAAAEALESHAGRSWQRFSRHLPQWRPGIDRLQNFMSLVNRELQGSL